HIGEKLSRKRGAGYSRATQFLNGLTGGGQKIFPSTTDKQRVERVFGEREIDDALGGLGKRPPPFFGQQRTVEDGEFSPVHPQLLPASGEGEHQAFRARPFHMARLEPRRGDD